VSEYLAIYLIGAALALLIALFMQGLMDASADIFAIVIVAAIWPISVPCIGAYALGLWFRERGWRRRA